VKLLLLFTCNSKKWAMTNIAHFFELHVNNGQLIFTIISFFLAIFGSIFCCLLLLRDYTISQTYDGNISWLLFTYDTKKWAKHLSGPCINDNSTRWSWSKIILYHRFRFTNSVGAKANFPIVRRTNTIPISSKMRQITLKAIIWKAPVSSFGGRNRDNMAA
jgi:hypothetical protein